MSQHDMDIANQAGAAFRADLNAALVALAGMSSGSSAPTTTFAYQCWADTNTGLLKMRNAANTAWITLGLLGTQNFGLAMPGSVVFHSKNAAPAGYLKCNGGAVSRTTYADLFAEVGTTFGVGDGSTTFNVPDLRGEFLRGWDDSRGVDTGRTFGSAQAQLVGKHAHRASATGSLSSGTPPESISTMHWFTFNSTGNYDSGWGSSVTGDGSLDARIGTENRPRNIALLACIKY